MAKWILAVVAVVMFAFAGLVHFRGEGFVSAERERMAADNAAREQQPGGSGFIEINPDVGKLQADAFLRGEVWFVLPSLGWLALGAVFLVAAALVALLFRKRKAADEAPAASP